MNKPFKSISTIIHLYRSASYHYNYVSIKTKNSLVLKIYDFNDLSKPHLQQVLESSIRNQIECISSIQNSDLEHKPCHRILDHGKENNIEGNTLGENNEEIKDVIKDIRSIRKNSLVLSHNDLHPNNIIVSNDGLIYLIPECERNG